MSHLHEWVWSNGLVVRWDESIKDTFNLWLVGAFSKARVNGELNSLELPFFLLKIFVESEESFLGYRYSSKLCLSSG